VKLLVGWLLLACLAGCDAGEVVVFASDAGAAGHSGSAGMGGNLGGFFGSAAGSAGLALGGAGAAGGSGGLAGDGMAGDSGYSCSTNSDCPGPAWLCSKKACYDATGICKPRPLDCEASHAPVCSCDGITFWNDCLREQQGVSTSTPGPCGANAKSCNNSSDCSGGDCAKLIQNLDGCGQPGRGVCHVTPPECMVVPESHWWVRCPPPNGQGSSDPGPCLTTCQAVQTGLPYVTAPKDACP
jgi:hypothetical protein